MAPTMAADGGVAATSRVLRLAAGSRVLLLTLICLFRLLFRPYDTSAVINPPCLVSSPPEGPISSPRWPHAAAVLESSVVWDGVYFARIAECGYEYEQTYAFFPLLPVAMSILARSIFAPLVPVLGYRATLVVSGYVLNNAAFVLAAVYFYRLSVLILKDSSASLLASLLFCFNPASVFYSSLYSESLYALLSLGGLFYLFSGANNVATVLLVLSGAARSNGAFNAGYFCFQSLLYAYVMHRKSLLLAVQVVVAAVLRSAIIFVPFLAFQVYGYYNICLNEGFNEPRSWCNKKIPQLYSFVQSHYWGVGFLRYYEMKQIPNFLLASPTLGLAVCSIIHYSQCFYRLFRSPSWHDQVLSVAEHKAMSEDPISRFSKTKHEVPAGHSHGISTVVQRKSVKKHITPPTIQDIQPNNLWAQQNALDILPFILHLAFLTLTALFLMHVQVSTRFLSSSPPIYWFVSHIFSSNKFSKRLGHLICSYFVAYILLGSLLFSNFYPFT